MRTSRDKKNWQKGHPQWDRERKEYQIKNY